MIPKAQHSNPAQFQNDSSSVESVSDSEDDSDSSSVDGLYYSPTPTNNIFKGFVSDVQLDKK